MVNNIKNWIIIAATLLLFLPCTLPAQSHNNEWNVSLGLGNSDLNGMLSGSEYVTLDHKLGGGLGIAYSHYFTRILGVSVGLEAQMYNNRIEAQYQNEYRCSIEKPEGLLNYPGDFFLVAHYGKVEEKQSAVLLQIPVTLRLQFPVVKKVFVFLETGIKAGFPLTSKWNQNLASLTTKGYSEYTGQYYEEMSNHGFDTYPNKNASGKLKLKGSVMSVLEGGLKWTVGEDRYLYTGFFLDNSLTNIVPADVKLLEYNPPADPRLNSIIYYNSSAHPFVFGLKIKMGFGIGGEKTKKPETPATPKKVEPQQPKKVEPETPKKVDEPKKVDKPKKPTITREHKTESVG